MGIWEKCKSMEIKQLTPKYPMAERKKFVRVIRKYLVLNGNENTTYQNLQDTARAVIREKYIAINIYIQEVERHQPIN